MPCQVLKDPVSCFSRKRSVLVSTFSSTYFMSSISSVSSSVSACSQISRTRCSDSVRLNITNLRSISLARHHVEYTGSLIDFLGSYAIFFSLSCTTRSLQVPTATAYCPLTLPLPNELVLVPSLSRLGGGRPLGHTHPPAIIFLFRRRRRPTRKHELDERRNAQSKQGA